MKAILGSWFVVACLGGSALAQSAGPASMPPQPGEAQAHHGDTGMVPPEDSQDDWGRREAGTRPHPMMDAHHPPFPPTRAGRFRIETGDISIGMTCPQDEAFKACADFTLQLIEKLGALPKR